MGKKKLIVAGEIYSHNLGDGVIHETTSYLIERVNPDVEVIAYDISLRRGWRQVERSRGRLAKYLSWIAGRAGGVHKLMMVLRYLQLRRTVVNPEYISLFSEACGVVIGGGHLLLDNNWNFPLKLYTVVLLAKEYNLPIHMFSCGVGASWSPVGGWLFRKTLAATQSISLRDYVSIERLKQLAPEVKCQLSADPALWASSVYDFKQETGGHKAIGLGVIHPWEINYHGRESISYEEWELFWVEVMRRLIDKGESCALFTNGSPADHDFAFSVQRRAYEAGIACSLEERPKNTRVLVELIQRYKAILAVRLHANIIAASYQVPAVGFAWDEKVKGFYTAMGYPVRCLDLEALDASRAVERLWEAQEQGVHKEKVDILRAQVHDNVVGIVTQMLRGCEDPALRV